MEMYLSSAREVKGEAREFLFALIDRAEKEGKGKEKTLYLEKECFLSLHIEKVATFHKKVKSYAISLQRIQEGDLMWIPEFTIYTEQDEEGKKHFYPCEYINHDFGVHYCFIEMKDNLSFEICKEIQSKAVDSFSDFLLGLKKDGYLSFEGCNDYEKTRLYKEYYNASVLGA